MIESPNLRQLIESLCCLPGVGRKSAQRIAYHLLQRDRDGARRLADSLHTTMDSIRYCECCRNFSETKRCQLCLDQKRDRTLLCVVENATDIVAIEQSDYQGLYFVLQGHISPLDGIGPDEVGFPELVQLLDERYLSELILATDSTVEGEATAHLIREIARKRKLKVTRIAQGIPVGGGLEYVNNRTIMHAMMGRREI